MEKQEIYDKVCAGLAKQGGPSVGDYGNKCMYRGSNGRACAAGLLIPDEIYKVSMDKGDVSGSYGYRELTDKYPEVKKCVGAENEDLVHDLQYVHDDCSPAAGTSFGTVRLKLRDVAEAHGITPGAEQAITEWN